MTEKQIRKKFKKLCDLRDNPATASDKRCTELVLELVNTDLGKLLIAESMVEPILIAFGFKK